MSSFRAMVPLLAHYNRWMNAHVYAAAARLSPDELGRERGAFFGSILGTLNHLVVADILWLQRFARHPSHPAALAPVLDLPQPAALDEQRFSGLDALRTHRAWLDACIETWAEGLGEDDLAVPLHYTDTRGVAASKPFDQVVLHFFNHQTHHRGQTTALLHQAGVDVGITDLLTLVPAQASPAIPPAP